jgi:hypothetical protein
MTYFSEEIGRRIYTYAPRTPPFFENISNPASGVCQKPLSLFYFFLFPFFFFWKSCCAMLQQPTFDDLPGDVGGLLFRMNQELTCPIW